MLTPMILALLAQAAPVATTDSMAPRDSLVLGYEFTEAGGEFARIELEAGQVYRVEVDGGQNVRIRALGAGEQQPRFTRTEPYPRASRTTAFEIAPFVTTVYEIRVGSIPRGTAAMRIFRDGNATARRQKVIHPA